MKDLYEVLRQKEMDIARVRMQIKALDTVIPLLADDTGHTESATGVSSAAPPYGRRNACVLCL